MLKAPIFFTVCLGSRTGADRSERSGKSRLSDPGAKEMSRNKKSLTHPAVLLFVRLLRGKTSRCIKACNRDLNDA